MATRSTLAVILHADVVGSTALVQKDENIDQFVTLLKQKIKSCEYAAAIVDDMVRDKLVFGIKDVTVKERLLREDSLTLQKALDVARASEASKLQIKEMNQIPAGTENIHMVKSKKNHHKPQYQKNAQSAQSQQKTETSNKKCGFCGKSHPPKQCPAYGKQCSYCHKFGHFVTVCRKKNGKKNVHAMAEESGEDSHMNCFASV